MSRFLFFPLDDFESPEAVLDALEPSIGMTCWDRMARAIGHDDSWESDGMGAAASVYELSDAERVAFWLASCVDDYRNIVYRYRESVDGRDLSRRITFPSPITDVRSILDATHAYVRSDDSGFWDARLVDEATAKGWLAEWVETNVPTDDEMAFA